ncbi:MAG: FecR family protein, partial [Chitinophagia bacterium]|nr:FecR family protein [Chitinophagia bacterium]
SNLDLFSALKIICIATNAAYEVNGTKILIKGKGCNN